MKISYTHDLARKELMVEIKRTTRQKILIKDEDVRKFVQEVLEENSKLKEKIKKLAEEVEGK